jgi:release factor glutamine methyltransferase
MVTIHDALRAAAADLRAAGIEGGRLDARLLLGHALGRDVWPHEDVIVDADQMARFSTLLGRRLLREPVSRILGKRAFWTLDLTISPATLDPRADSESLIEAALAAFKDRPPPARILDLGTGTGCLLLAALVEFPDARGVGVDISADAIAVATANARSNGLGDRAAFHAADWGHLPPLEPFDLVLSNPPYIAEPEIAALEPEVRVHDPIDALVAGSDGLDAYRALAPVVPRVLAPRGFAVLELGVGQGSLVASTMAAVGLMEHARRADLAGIERALVLKWNDTRSTP